jgi:hypothetical protein
MKDENESGRMNGTGRDRASTSSFILHPSSFPNPSSFILRLISSVWQHRIDTLLVGICNQGINVQ